MPKTAKRKTKPRQRTCLNVEISPVHVRILDAIASERSDRAGRTVTKSDVIRDWIWDCRSILGPEKNSEES